MRLFIQMSLQYDGTCDYLGCTDNNALNFNSLANLDDGSVLIQQNWSIRMWISTSTNLDTINGQYTSVAPSLLIIAINNSSTNVEFSYEMNVLSYNYEGYSQAQVYYLEMEF